VVHDQTLTGSGTLASPLGAVQSEALIEPVVSAITINFAAGSYEAAQGTLFTVPAGKRLVVEHVSGVCIMQPGQRVLIFGITTRLATGATDITHVLVPVFIGTSIGTGDTSSVSQAIKTYAGPGTIVLAGAIRSANTAFGLCTVVLSGFLVNLP
jgi:hypothetical protein